MIRVLIVDDHDLLRAGLRMIVEAEPDLTVVGEAADGMAAIDLIRRLQPDVTLMDIRMPGPVDGLAATRAVAGNSGGAGIVILTIFDTDENIHAALDAGASGFLLKNSPPERLLAAIRTIANGDSLLEPAVTTRVIAEFSRRRPRTTTDPGLALLTEREREVLRYIATGRSNSEIASHLYVSEATVKSHVTQLLHKLVMRDRVQLVVLAYETGFVTPGEQQQPPFAQDA